MVDNDQVTSIIAAMSTSKDGWHLSCDLDNIRNDGKIVAAFNVGYGDTLYVLAMGNYGNDGKSDLVQGVLYVPGDNPHSSAFHSYSHVGASERRYVLELQRYSVAPY